MYNEAITIVRTCEGIIRGFRFLYRFVLRISIKSIFLCTSDGWALTKLIQEEVPWCMLFADDIVLADETRSGANANIEIWQENLRAFIMCSSTWPWRNLPS